MVIGHSRNRKGFTLVEVMIVILVIGVLLMIAVPNFLTARARSRQRTCLTNQKQLNGAKEQFAMEHNLGNGDLVTSADLAPVYLKEYPFCPEGGNYSLNPIGIFVECSENVGPYNHNFH